MRELTQEERDEIRMLGNEPLPEPIPGQVIYALHRKTAHPLVQEAQTKRGFRHMAEVLAENIKEDWKR